MYKMLPCGFNYFTVCRLPGVNTGNNSTFYLEDVSEGAIATGDFNGDGLDDLVVGGVQGVVQVIHQSEDACGYYLPGPGRYHHS